MNSLSQISSPATTVSSASSSSSSSSSTAINAGSIDSILSKVANRILVTLPNPDSDFKRFYTSGSSNFMLGQYSTVSGVWMKKITEHPYPRSGEEVEEFVRGVVKEVRRKVSTCDDFIPNSWGLNIENIPDCYNRFGSACVKVLQFQRELTVLRGVTTYVVKSPSSDFSYPLMARFVAITQFGRAACEDIAGATALKCYEIGLKTLFVTVDRSFVDYETTRQRTQFAFPILLINIEKEKFDKINTACRGEDRISQILSQIGSGICFDSVTNEAFLLEDLREKGQKMLQRVKLYSLNDMYLELTFDPANHMSQVSVLCADAKKVYERTRDILLKIGKSNFDLDKLQDAYKKALRSSHEHIQEFLQYQEEKTKQLIAKCREMCPDLIWKKKGITVWGEGAQEKCELVKNNLKSIGYEPSVKQIKNSSQYVCMLSIESQSSSSSSSSSTSTTFERKT